MAYKTEDILKHISNVSHNLKWRDIEQLCKDKDFTIRPTRKGFKVNIGKSVWCMHPEHRISNELKHGIIRNLRKVLIKEGIL